MPDAQGCRSPPQNHRNEALVLVDVYTVRNKMPCDRDGLDGILFGLPITS